MSTADAFGQRKPIYKSADLGTMNIVWQTAYIHSERRTLKVPGRN